MDNNISGTARTGPMRQNVGNSLYENVPNQQQVSSGENQKGYQRQDSRVSRSLASTGKLTETQNPYALYNSIDNDSLDDGIHMDLSPGESSLGDMVASSSDLPPEDVVLREFADYMDVMSPMSEPEDIALRNTTIQEKWTLLINQKNRSPVFNVRYYIENLKQNQGTRRKKFSIGKSSKAGSGGLGYVLHKLKLDLKMSPKIFLADFMKDSNHGVQLLVQILMELQRDKNIMNTARKSKKDELERSLEEEADCLLCLRFLLRTEEGVKKMSSIDGVYDLVALAMLSTKASSRTTALKILTVLCSSAPSGFQRVMEAMTRLKNKLNEDVLFRTLCNGLKFKDYDVYLPFWTAAVRFFNALILGTNNASGRVHLQHELEMAGFRPDQLETLARGTTFEHDELSQELDRWKNNFIDVTHMKDEKTTLESRNKMLRDEISRMEEQIKMIGRLKKQEEKEKKRTEEKAEEYRERAAELQDTVEKLRKMYEDKTGRAVGDDAVNVVDVLKPLDLPLDSFASNFSSVRSISSTFTDVPDAPPLPPVAPPLDLNQKKNVPTPNVELPFLNWTPLQKVHDTIFQGIDENAVYQDLDLSDFESQFKLQRQPESSLTKQKRQRLSQHHSLRLHFIDLNRAKNISITKHRTGKTSREIKEAIETCDVTKLPGEYAELLIKFIPTKEEIKLLSQHKDEYWKMGEAEQFLFQLAQVERLESKLSILAFMGIFEELVNSVKPNIGRVLEASNSVLSSQGLKKVFEIILAFGNFMNGSKRGYAVGFRLESLSKLTDVKSTDKQMTLMHYVVEHIQRNHPEFLNFYQDANLNIDKGASYHALGQDVVWLRKGIDLVKFERERQKTNHSLERFYSSASVQVAEIAESFKKMEEAYRDVCLAMGENYKSIEPSWFFRVLADFFHEFKTAHRDILKRSTQRLSPSSKVRKQSKGPAKNQAPAPPEPKKEAPKIIAPLTPVVATITKTAGQTKTKPPGPVAGQHNVMVSSQSKHKPQPTRTDTKAQEERKQSVKKKAAPEPPPDYPRDGVKDTVPSLPIDHGHSKKYPAVKKGHVNVNTPKVGQNSAQKPEDKPEVKMNGPTGNLVNGDHHTPAPTQASVEKLRSRTESEVLRAEVTDALAELDLVVEFEEKMAGHEDIEVECSHL